MNSPGPLLAQGRDADIFEYGPNLVLRRSRHDRSLVIEAEIMRYAQAQGYPVPTVDEVSDDGLEMTMERIDGPVMIDELSKRPWALKRSGAMLADLHHQLHQIEGPAWLDPSPVGTGNRLLHLDLHPINIIMAKRGPVVIDWARAARGGASTDLALTWVLIAAAGLPKKGIVSAAIGRFRQLFVNGFLSHIDVDAARAELAQVVAWKVQDPNMTAEEHESMWDLVRRQSPAA